MSLSEIFTINVKHIIIALLQGQAITAELNRRGATVYMLVRDEQRGRDSIQRLQKEGCEPNRLILRFVDLAHFQTLRDFAKSFMEEVPRLDILICNAGVLRVPVFTRTVDGFEKTWQCNYLVELMLPLLSKSEDGRIINVSSVLYEYADSVSLKVVNNLEHYGGMIAYSRSKMAQVMYTRYLAKLLEEKNLPITVTVCHPGNVDTNILKESGYLWLSVVFRPIVWFILKTENDGAQMPLYLALSKTILQCNGQYFRNFAIHEVIEKCKPIDACEALYVESRKAVGLSE
ncbi:oxidoreductase, short chain dehydrogenase/reductase family protein [Dictyocaulus viviparus]|uniref:Oxidoreductase, short chain dehydrogenase/reductase family protein n=1 Tax=Dictyocaulus viviparus TaxID=29172 RepID=A0A0D8XK28_DICVI|nr:oxidoreductase, short chain dehydrogenase/reductase family protein [Dictyocaulus viviparus]